MDKRQNITYRNSIKNISMSDMEVFGNKKIAENPYSFHLKNILFILKLCGRKRLMSDYYMYI